MYEICAKTAYNQQLNKINLNNQHITKITEN